MSSEFMNTQKKVILVTGANGQLGNEMRQVSENSANQYLFTDVAELDITDLEAVRKGLCVSGQRLHSLHGGYAGQSVGCLRKDEVGRGGGNPKGGLQCSDIPHGLALLGIW